MQTVEKTKMHSSDYVSGESFKPKEALRRRQSPTALINSAIQEALRCAANVSLENPSVLIESIKMIWHQKKASMIRAKWASKGITVPPYAILSVTHKCNLNCTGCFDKVLHPSTGEELSNEDWARVIDEAASLGVSVFVIIGGEPFCRKNLLNITSRFPRCIFLIFNNCTLLKESAVLEMTRQRNVIPVLSVEGFASGTDARRGKGVYGKFEDAVALLRRYKIFFGVSITLSGDNFRYIENDDFVDELYYLGARLFFLVEYLPAEPFTEYRALDCEKKARLGKQVARFRKKYGALFLDFPGDEYELGGCLSAGRGFIHVSAEGNVEPCPFSPYSDSNLKECSLLSALCSPLFTAIRNHPDNIEETKGDCALWTERNWVKSLVSE